MRGLGALQHGGGWMVRCSVTWIVRGDAIGHGIVTICVSLSVNVGGISNVINELALMPGQAWVMHLYGHGGNGAADNGGSQ